MCKTKRSRSQRGVRRTKNPPPLGVGSVKVTLLQKLIQKLGCNSVILDTKKAPDFSEALILLELMVGFEPMTCSLRIVLAGILYLFFAKKQNLTHAQTLILSHF